MSHLPHTIKHRTAVVVWLLAGLLLVLPTGHHAMAGILVCIGVDGHVDIEDGRWSDCATNTTADPHFLIPEVQQDAGDDCGDCIDVPLMANPSDGRVAVVKPALPIPDLHLAVGPEQLDLPLGALEQVQPRPRTLAPPPSPLGLQTVVLRV